MDAANPTPGPHAHAASPLPTKPSLPATDTVFKLSNNKIYLICLGKQLLTGLIMPNQEAIRNQFTSRKENVLREIPQGLCVCFPIMGNTAHTFMPSGHGKSSDKTVGEDAFQKLDMWGQAHHLPDQGSVTSYSSTKEERCSPHRELN